MKYTHTHTHRAGGQLEAQCSQRQPAKRARTTLMVRGLRSLCVSLSVSPSLVAGLAALVMKSCPGSTSTSKQTVYSYVHDTFARD